MVNFMTRRFALEDNYFLQILFYFPRRMSELKNYFEFESYDINVRGKTIFEL